MGREDRPPGVVAGRRRRGAAAGGGLVPRLGLCERALAGAYTHFSASDGQRLLAFVNVISDGQFYALLVDLLVHPDVQRRGLGRALVACAVRSLEADGIWAVQAVFDPTLEPFYRACGFAMCQAGLVRTAAAGRGPAPARDSA